MNLELNLIGRAGGVMAALLAFSLFGQLASAQVQRKPKAPKPPSYEDVMQRALEQKKAASNAPVLIQPVKPVVPLAKIQISTNAATASKPTVSVDELLQEAKVAKPAATPTTPPVVVAPAGATAAKAVPVSPVAPAPDARTERNAATVAMSPALIEDSKPSKSAKTKGPVFSPLPPDLAPANDPAVPQSAASAAPGVSGVVTNAMDNLDDKHQLVVGDRVSFRIVEDEDAPRSLEVMASGELELPYLGRFMAVNRNCRELARAIKTELEKDYYHKATVIVALDQMARTRGRIYTVGALRTPGPQEIPSDESFTLSKAILRAGGFTDFADKKNVKVTRRGNGGEQVFTVNVAQILEKSRSELDLVLQPDDLVYVPERLFRY